MIRAFAIALGLCMVALALNGCSVAALVNEHDMNLRVLSLETRVHNLETPGVTR